MISLPVTCPRCGKSSHSEFPLQVVVMALTRWNNMALYCRCHPSNWSASPQEMQGIRDFLGQEWLAAHRKLVAPAAEGSVRRGPSTGTRAGSLRRVLH